MRIDHHATQKQNKKQTGTDSLAMMFNGILRIINVQTSLDDVWNHIKIITIS